MTPPVLVGTLALPVGRKLMAGTAVDWPSVANVARQSKSPHRLFPRRMSRRVSHAHEGTLAAPGQHISAPSQLPSYRRRPCRSITDVSSDSATDLHWRTVRSAVYTGRARMPGDRSMLQEGRIRGPAPGYHKAHCRRHRWVVRDRWCIEEIGWAAQGTDGMYTEYRG